MGGERERGMRQFIQKYLYAVETNLQYKKSPESFNSQCPIDTQTHTVTLFE